MKAAVIVSAMLGTLVSAGSAGMWAQFCDDAACSENCGIPVDIYNPSCLSHEGGRHSIKMHGDNWPDHFLVSSPGTDCNCQNDCIGIPGSIPNCINISGKATAYSYRFQYESCFNIDGDNNHCDDGT
ncbi:hypothetical protein F4818DRAFT_411254 [Hypoxylon cercidicola]|nr:hypothetical protein F4818DRAFT_411254 [Hypoxylon cercidicola]